MLRAEYITAWKPLTRLLESISDQKKDLPSTTGKSPRVWQVTLVGALQFDVQVTIR